MGVLGRFLALQQFLAIVVTLAQFVVLSMAFFTFFLYKSELLQIRTMESLLLLRIFAKFADHKRFFFTFILLLNFLRYLLAFFFLSDAKFSFAIFAKFVDFWRAFFDFVLFRYERLQNLLFLVLIRYLLKCYSMIAMKILVTFEIFATFADFSRPSWPFSF